MAVAANAGGEAGPFSIDFRAPIRWKPWTCMAEVFNGIDVEARLDLMPLAGIPPAALRASSGLSPCRSKTCLVIPPYSTAVPPTTR